MIHSITKKVILFGFSILIGLAIKANALEIDDMAGSADHPKLNRVAGTKIVAYDKSDYAGHEFLIGHEKKNFVTSIKEGKLTRLVYALKEGQTGLFALRNYQETVAKLGNVKERYSCRERECPNGIGNKFIWGKDKRLNSNIKTINKMYSIQSYHKGSRYWLAEVESDTASYTVSVYSASAAHKSENDKNTSLKEGLSVGQTFLHIDIIESSSFKSDLEVVEASKIQQSISEKGHIALYGLLFDTGKDRLKEESKPALTEIAKALTTDKNLNVYVVGHTDNVGSLPSNQQLSERRAASIVNSLVNEFGIAPSRLIPIGVGLAAPISTNDTEEGRSLNRRVELVKR